MSINQFNNKNQSWRQGKVKNKRSARYVSKPIRKSAIKIKKRPEFKKISWKAFLFNKTTLKIFTILFLAGLLFSFFFVAWVSKDLPDPNKLMERQIAQSTKIYDRSGENVLYEIHGDEQRTLIDLNDIPDYVKWATIAIEDKDFYEHGGISIWGILRGVIWQPLRGKGAQGGSTLTQQFVKNAILTNERTVTRKIKEWILAYKIEEKFSKDEILQMYLNEIPYGSTAYGVEAASQKYFGKSAADLKIAEAAVLAALPQAPSRYSPYGPNRDILIGRQHYVLEQMYEQGYISEAKMEAAKLYELEFKQQSADILAPHFVMYVKDMLSEEYGEKMIEQGGLKIYTTLDLYKQQIAEEVIADRAEKNETNYNATNAALVSIDPKTGEILAMVGSKDYFSEEIDGQVNIATSLRQPGSSIKPLVYASAFDKGYTPDTILYDVVTNFSNNDDEEESYEPHNYDSEEHGPVSIRKALAGSLNIPAVKAMYLAGIDNVLDWAEKFGYTTLTDRDRFGLSLVLGGGEVKLLEHTNAFSAFAREGKIMPINAILRVEDSEGKVLQEFEGEEKEIIEAEVARMINDVLSDNDARAYAFGIDNWLNLGSRPVAAKTGTTNDYRDAWTVGYTPSIVTGVWVGNNDNSEMKRGAAGGVVAAPIWHNYMKKVLGDTPIEYFKELGDIKTGKAIIDGEVNIGKTVKIDKASGLLATEYTPESFIEEISFTENHSILYYVDKDDPLGDIPEHPEDDPQFELWESRVLEWEKEQFASSTVENTAPPTEYDNLHKPENQPSFKILSPTNNQTITQAFLTARVDASAPRGINRVEYYINDNLLASVSSYPFSLEKQINFLNNGYHNLKVRVCDDIDNCSEQSVEFNLILENNQLNQDMSLSWLAPGNGLAVSNIDFPLNLSFKVDNPTAVAKIEIFSSKDDISELLGIIEPVDEEIVSYSWNNVPESGTYKIYAQALGWAGASTESGEIILSVSNIEKVEEEDGE